MKKYGRKIFITLLISALCTGCAQKSRSTAAVTGTIGEDEPIKREQVAKMLALSVYDIDTVDNMERKIAFEDTSADKPCDKYINAAFTAGLISGADERHFEPQAYLTLEQAQFLLDKIDKTGTLKLKYNTDDRKKPISSAMWTEVFERASELNGNSAISSCNLITYATGQSCTELGDAFIMTDRGLLGVECCGSDSYSDCTVSALIRGKEILAFKEVINNEPSVMGAVVKNCDEDGVTLDMGGIERYFYADDPKSLRAGDTVSFKYSGSKITALDSTHTAEGVSVDVR